MPGTRNGLLTSWLRKVLLPVFHNKEWIPWGTKGCPLISNSAYCNKGRSKNEMKVGCVCIVVGNTGLSLVGGGSVECLDCCFVPHVGIAKLVLFRS